ncbi:MAG: AbrB/MazE/SpoVT family DNA-binding domain-containing protein [Gemmatimonadetes bacterium]|nr:AbrB/MazE/SpoVT family DNA-binding domain-containing protein [Gemmatimonadota bacterium]
MAETMLKEDGHLLLPKEVLEYLHLHPGDRLNIVIQNNGDVVIKSNLRDVRDLKGILSPPSKPVSIEDMKRAIRLRGSKNQFDADETE